MVAPWGATSSNSGMQITAALPRAEREFGWIQQHLSSSLAAFSHGTSIPSQEFIQLAHVQCSHFQNVSHGGVVAPFSQCDRVRDQCREDVPRKVHADNSRQAEKSQDEVATICQRRATKFAETASQTNVLVEREPYRSFWTTRRPRWAGCSSRSPATTCHGVPSSQKVRTTQPWYLERHSSSTGIPGGRRGPD